MYSPYWYYLRVLPSIKDGMWLEIEVTYLMAPESPLTLLCLASVYDCLVHLHVLWETECQSLEMRLQYHATTSQQVVLHVNRPLIYDSTYYTCSSINSTKVAGVRLNIVHARVTSRFPPEQPKTLLPQHPSWYSCHCSCQCVMYRDDWCVPILTRYLGNTLTVSLSHNMLPR